MESDLPVSTTPRCSIFGQCGGCDYQHLGYSEELEIKNGFVREQFAKFPFFDQAMLDPVVASPQEYSYRHRLDMKVVRTRENKLLMGFTPPPVPERKFGLLEVSACPIAMDAVSDFLPELLREIRANLPEKHRRGTLTVRTGDDGRVVYGGIGKNSLNLREEDYLWTSVHGKKIFYSLDTFFQANLSILPKLFDKLYALDCWGPETVFYDLYGGVGLFGTGLSDKAGKIYLIEENDRSVRLAKYNVAHHGFRHFEVIEGKVEKYFSELLSRAELQGKKHVAMIDPPRSGLSPQSIKFLNQAIDRLDVLLYLSCNPKTLVENLSGLHKGGWKMERIIPFDFFPKTVHVETLVILKS